MNIRNLYTQLHNTALDLLFPPSQRTQEIRKLDTNTLSNLPTAEPTPDDFTRASYAYQHKTVRQIVQAAKYDGSHRAAQIMGALLYDEVMDLCAKQRVFSQNITLVPIPLHYSRYNERGFNQARRIASAIVTQDSQQTLRCYSALKKTKQTPAQVTLSKPERKQNVVNCFTLKNAADITDKPVVLIDDVTTTGATFKAARKALQAGNPQTVLALAFAH